MGFEKFLNEFLDSSPPSKRADLLLCSGFQKMMKSWQPQIYYQLFLKEATEAIERSIKQAPSINAIERRQFVAPLFQIVYSLMEKLLSKESYTKSLLPFYLKFYIQCFKKIEIYLKEKLTCSSDCTLDLAFGILHDIILFNEQTDTLILLFKESVSAAALEYLKIDNQKIGIEIIRSYLLKEIQSTFKELKSIPTLFRKTGRPVRLIIIEDSLGAFKLYQQYF